MPFHNNKAMAINIVFLAVISLIVVVVIATIFLTQTNKHNQILNEGNNQLLMCDCIHRLDGEQVFCHITECVGLAQFFGVDCEKYKNDNSEVIIDLKISTLCLGENE